MHRYLLLIILVFYGCSPVKRFQQELNCSLAAISENTCMVQRNTQFLRETSTIIYKQNQLLDRMSYSILENQEAINASTIAIVENRKAVEKSSAEIEKNEAWICKCNCAISQNVQNVNDTTSLFSKGKGLGLLAMGFFAFFLSSQMIITYLLIKKRK